MEETHGEGILMYKKNLYQSLEQHLKQASHKQGRPIDLHLDNEV